MRHILIREAKPKRSKLMTGAVMVAIEKAIRFDTPMVVQKNGKIQEISPQALKRKIKAKQSR